jgi:hypothetical protein
MPLSFTRHALCSLPYAIKSRNPKHDPRISKPATRFIAPDTSCEYGDFQEARGPFR